MEMLQPLQPHERYRVADALRGLALLAIFIANIPVAENPVFSGRQPVLNSTQTNEWLRAFFHLFIDKKFVSIFSILFGFGFYIQLNRASQQGAGFRKYFLLRMFLLLLIGCLHAYLLWFGDIIRDYAICGMLLLLVYKWPSRRLLTTGLIVAVLLTGIVFIVNAALGLQQYSYDPAIVQDHPLATNYSRYLVINATIDPFVNFVQDSPITLVFAFGCMLIGFWIGRIGLFAQPQVYSRNLNRLIIIGSIAGLAGSYAFWKISTGELEITPALIWLPIVVVGGLLLHSLFYIGAFVKLYQYRWFQRLVTPFELVGRMALTNYILQSLFYHLVFFHALDGFKLYGQVSPAETWILVLLLFVLQVLFSKFWLSKFGQGPIEAIWKKLAYRFAKGKLPQNGSNEQLLKLRTDTVQ